MGKYSCSAAINSSTPAGMLFDAFVSASGIISGVFPPVLKSTEVVEHFTCGEGNRDKTVKQKVEARDNKKFIYCYSIMEGDALGTILEEISLDVKITASPKGGSVCKITSKHSANNGVAITEEKILAVKEKAIAAFQVIEDYLVANPRG
ncbi:major allergen Pru ar 1-like [Eucalyptus grandis]|uniref:major allergen Pru ar 1-like n=1 Tax=Eucalyptus grandis TaxID=71139 RepID=UPI00192EA436|nr:major allergen Pru ar 1-like [Eucalyptus grandis]